jgi:hypothetical protein
MTCTAPFYRGPTSEVTMTTKYKAVLGVDPGEKGAICLLVPSLGRVEFMPTNTVPYKLLCWLQAVSDTYNVSLVMIEDVHSIFGVSAGSNFNFGFNLGLIHGLLEQIHTMKDTVTPKKWQKQLGITEKGKGIKKNTFELIQKLYPTAPLTGPKGGLLDGRSDALAIAHYATYFYKERLST